MAEQISGPAASDDWTAQVADRIESVVQAVRTKTTVPIGKLARVLVFGIIVALVGSVAGVLLVVTLIRVIDGYLPFHPHARQVWVTDAGLGAIFLLAGAFFMRRTVVRSR